MTSYDDLTANFFLWLKKHFSESTAFVRPFEWANRYNVPEKHLQELLKKWATDDLIWLGAWDGMKERPWNQWLAERDVFRSGADNGCVRVKLLAAGGHFAESIAAQLSPETPEIARNKIGFTSA